MKIKLISYANKAFYKSQQVLKKSALKYGVDEVIDYNENWLKKQFGFYNSNKYILSQKRGNGYWLWKPYVILDALNNLKDGDLLIYLDSGSKIIAQLKSIIEIAQKKKLLLFYNNDNQNKKWTKRDCFYYMNCDSSKYTEPSQIVASYIFIVKTNENIKLVEEWLQYAQDWRIMSDNPNQSGLTNYPEFIDHRHDQSILTNLALKYNFELFRDPSQWGNKYKKEEYRVIGEFVENGYVQSPFLNSPYPTIIDGHRKKLPLTFRDRIYFLLNKHQV